MEEIDLPDTTLVEEQVTKRRKEALKKEDKEEEDTGAEEYEIEDILEKRKEGRQIWYKVKWVGYDETSWEPVRRLEAINNSRGATCHQL